MMNRRSLFRINFLHKSIGRTMLIHSNLRRYIRHTFMKRLRPPILSRRVSRTQSNFRGNNLQKNIRFRLSLSRTFHTRTKRNLIHSRLTIPSSTRPINRPLRLQRNITKRRSTNPLSSSLTRRHLRLPLRRQIRATTQLIRSR